MGTLFQNIYKRIRLVFILSFLIMVFLVLFLIQLSLKSTLINHLNDKYQNQLEVLSSSFESFLFNNYSEMLIPFVKNIKEDIVEFSQELKNLNEDDRENPSEYIKYANKTLIDKMDILSSNQNISLIYIGLVGWSKYLSNTDITSLDKSYNAMTRPWYINVLQNRNYFQYKDSQIIISNPYIDSLTNKTVITISIGIPNNLGEIFAIVSFDFMINNMFQPLSSTQKQANVFFGLEDGTVLFTSDNRTIRQDEKIDKFMPKLTPEFIGENNFLLGKDSLFIIKKLKFLQRLGLRDSVYKDWVIFYEDKDFIILYKKYLIMIAYTILPIFLVFLIIITVYLKEIELKLTDPLSVTKNKIDEISRGILYDSLLKTNYSSEISPLNESVNFLNTKFKDFFFNLNKEIHELLYFSNDLIKLNSFSSFLSKEVDDYSVESISISDAIKLNYSKNKHDIDSVSSIIENYSEKIENINELISKSNSSIENIILRIETINEIAYNTNLISLNASVEASKISSGSKAFSLISFEIRKLANRSSEASEYISKNTSDISSNLLKVSESINILLKEFLIIKDGIENIVDNFNKNRINIKNIELFSQKFKKLSDNVISNNSKIIDISNSIDNTSKGINTMSGHFVNKKTFGNNI